MNRLYFFAGLLATALPASSQTNLADPRTWDAQEIAAKADIKAELAKERPDYQLVADSAAQLKVIQARRDAAAEPHEPPDGKIDLSSTKGFEALQKRRISLRKSPEAGDSDKPANFTWSKDIEAGTGTSFNADFYLKYVFQSWNDLDGDTSVFHDVAASVQGKLTDDDLNDAWRFRLERNISTYNRDSSSAINGWVAMMSFIEENDRDFDVARLGGEAWFSLNALKAGIGGYQTLIGSDEDPVVAARWRPYLGVSAGAFLEDDALVKDVDDTFRLMARGTVDISLPRLARWLTVEEITLSADDSLHYLPDAEDAHNYLTCGLNVGLSDVVGVGLDYSVGRDSPKYVREEEISAGFTVKF